MWKKFDRNRLPTPARQSHLPPQFTIGSLLLLMTLVGIGLAAYRVSPFFVGIVAIPAFPALVRTFIICRYRRLRGEMLSFNEKIELFVASVYATGLMLLAALTSFVVVKWLAHAGLAMVTGLPADDPDLINATNGAGLVASLAAFALAFWGMIYFPRNLP